MEAKIHLKADSAGDLASIITIIQNSGLPVEVAVTEVIPDRPIGPFYGGAKPPTVEDIRKKLEGTEEEEHC